MDSGECDGSHNPDLTESMGSDLHMNIRRELTRVTIYRGRDSMSKVGGLGVHKWGVIYSHSE